MTTPIRMLHHMLEPLMPLLDDGTEDIAINEPRVAWVRRGGCWSRFDVPMIDFDALMDATILAASVSQQETGARNPLLFTDIPMPEGPPLRLQSVWPPAIEPGLICWGLRQPGRRIYSTSEVVGRYDTSRWNKWQHRKDRLRRHHEEALALYDSGDITGFLEHLVRAKYNTLLAGSTGAGKSTAGTTMIDAIPLNERIITIENAREYQMRHPNRVHLLYSQGDLGVAVVTQQDLQVASLRLRPDRVLVQELLNKEAAETYVMEVISGHPGSITTIHGRDATQAGVKLFNLIKSSDTGRAQKDETVISMISAAIDCIIPFHSDGTVFSIGECWFAPDAARRDETFGDLLRDAA